MELFESYYWKYTIILQKFVGIWFLQDIRKNYLSWIYVYSFLFAFSTAMGVRLYMEIGVNVDIVIENVLGEMYLCGVFSKITISIISRDKFAVLLKQIAEDWRKFNDEEELKIMHKYAEYGRQTIHFYASFMISAVLIFNAAPIISPILDVIVPLENGTRPKMFPYYAEYGIDMDKYFYPLLGQAFIGGIGTIVVLVSYDLGFILIVQHVVGLFALVNSRLTKVEKISEAIENGVLESLRGDCMAQYYTISAANLHKSVISYIDMIEDYYNISWFIILFQNMIMLGGGLFVTLMKLDQPRELFRYGIVTIGSLVHFYFVFNPGQKVINSSEEVFEYCYGCKWYNLSKRTKTLINIMQLRSFKKTKLTGGKMFIMSMDTYCNMMRTGLSFFTVLHSSK